MTSNEKPAELNPFSVATTKEFAGHKKKVHWVAWNCTGKRLASTSADNTTRIWEVERHSHGKEIELRGHSDSVDQVCWDPTNPDRLATVSTDRTVKLWDLRSSNSGRLVGSVTTLGENINVGYSPSGAHILAGNRDDTLAMIDTRTLRILRTIQYPFEVNEFAWSPNGQMLFVTTGLGTIEVLRYPSMETMHTLAAHTSSVFCISFSPNGEQFAVGSADSLVSLWDFADLACIRTFTRHDSPVRTCSFSHDGRFLATAGERQEVHRQENREREDRKEEAIVIDIVDVSSGTGVHQIPCRENINCVAWSPTAALLAYVTEDVGRDSGLVRVFGFPAS